MAALGTPVAAAEGASAAQEHELRVLYEIIHTVNSTLDLEQVLGAIVRLVNDAVVAHATYIFLSEDRGRRIVLRAASERYAHLSGRVSMAAGEGIAGWVLQNAQPVFIPEKALADPRIKYLPELEEEKYQSLVSVPLIAKGQRVIGVIALHAEAPRVFSPQDAAFLLHVASLVAYAIENARLYERTRRSLRELEQLSQLGTLIARAESVDDLLAVTVEEALGLLGAESLRVYLLEPGGDRLRMRASSPGAEEGPDIVSLPELSGELQRTQASGGTLTSVLAGTLWGAATMRSALVAPLVAGDEVMGFLVARLGEDRRASEHARDLANSIAAQSALGLKRLQLVERLAERNLIKDLFDALASGRSNAAIAAQARRLGIDAGARGRRLGAARRRERRGERGLPARRRGLRGRGAARHPGRSRRPLRGRAAPARARARGRVGARAHRGHRGGAPRRARRRPLQRLQRAGCLRGRVQRGPAGRSRPAGAPPARAAPALRRARRLQVPPARAAR